MTVDGKNDPDRDNLSPEQRAALEKRAEALGERLDRATARRPEISRADAEARGNALGQAFKISAELVAGVAMGGGIGWFLDRQLGTRPWLLVVFLILGFCAGMLNVIRSAQSMQASSEPMQRRAPSVRDDAVDDDDK